MEVYDIYPDKEFDGKAVENFVKVVAECIKANNELLKNRR